jgi:DNA helicase-2/ATP-dependent DNA helicase PcrA
MMSTASVLADDHADDRADEQIGAGLDLDNPVSFFLFADAGSGKTRSLVKALDRIRKVNGKRLRLTGKRVGVITYTNAACDEIRNRTDFDPLIEVSTIHSFVWSLISGLHTDIKKWLKSHLEAQIDELKELQDKGRAGTKAAHQREEAISAKQQRLANLEHIGRFCYNPNGENRERGSLNHAEVIQIGADFLTAKSVMRRILVSKFPILLVDESQDTNKALIEALFKVQEEHRKGFCLGLFGDVMQRIYGDGKDNLGQDVPQDWAKPTKKLNHRCPRRVIRLINEIRSSVDGHEQLARSDSEEGFVRFFILPSDVSDKAEAERRVAQKMAAVTGDHLWDSKAEVRTLVLEHHMAARRMGFRNLFNALDQVESLRTGLRDGSLPGVRLFSQLVLPLIRAKARGDEFAVAAILREASPLLSKARLKSAGAGQPKNIQAARGAVNELTGLWSGGAKPRFLDVLNCVGRTELFELPESLQPFVNHLREAEQTESGSEELQTDPVLHAWGDFLEGPFAEIEPYDEYVNGRGTFETHQGVKGREFPRVMVVIDDTEARGFMFSYDKLFGAKSKSPADIEHESEGTDSGVDRTRRLFYVIASRARKSLAIVAYSANPEKIREHVLREGWFEEGEVQVGL